MGGREYFDRPLFRAVEHADIPAFLRETLRAVEEVDGGVLESRELVEHTEALRRRYGRDAERACLQRFAQQAADLLAGTPAPQPMAACA